MNKQKIYISLFIVVVLIFGFLFFRAKDSKEEVIYSDPEYPLSFSYKTGTNGYIFFADENFETVKETEPLLLRILVLIGTEEYQSLAEDLKVGIPREGPPQMIFFIVSNKDNLTLDEWFDKSPFINHESIIGEVNETLVGGVKALSYRSVGLYANENVMVAKDNYIFFFNVSFLSPEDKIYTDFQEILKTVSF